MLLKFSKSSYNNFQSVAKKNFGANIKAIKTRLKSVTSIEKITKAMKMVFIYLSSSIL